MRRACHVGLTPSDPGLVAVPWAAVGWHDRSMSRGNLVSGVCGWDYRHWQGRFYPPDLAKDQRLSFVAGAMDGVEIDTTFYGLRTPADFLRWRSQVPAGFTFAVKGSRFITHMKRLKSARQALANFFASGPLALEDSLGPFLWQLPASQRWDAERVDGFLTELPRDTDALRALAADHDPDIVSTAFLGEGQPCRPVRHALEPRDSSFADPQVCAVLRAHGVAMVMADSAGQWPTFDCDSAGFRYLRLHGTAKRKYSGSYHGKWEPWSSTAADALEMGHDVYVFFDNDSRAQAPRDAVELSQLLAD